MAEFLGGVGGIGMIISFVWLIIAFVKKGRTRNPWIGLIGCLVLGIIGGILSTDFSDKGAETSKKIKNEKKTVIAKEKGELKTHQATDSDDKSSETSEKVKTEKKQPAQKSRDLKTELIIDRKMKLKGIVNETLGKKWKILDVEFTEISRRKDKTSGKLLSLDVYYLLPPRASRNLRQYFEMFLPSDFAESALKVFKIREVQCLRLCPCIEFIDDYGNPGKYMLGSFQLCSDTHKKINWKVPYKVNLPVALDSYIIHSPPKKWDKKKY